MDDIAALGLLEDESIELDSAALQIAQLDHPDTSLDPYLDLLGAITDRVAVVGADAASPRDRAAALALVFSDEYGFRGDRQTYDDPDNADLIRVVDRRRGLPVSLAILYAAAARRVGWEADVLNTPGHVLLRVGSETEPVLVDAFNGGGVLSSEQLAALLRGVLGPEVRPTNEHLAPMTNRQVLVRLLLNQATRAEAGGKPGRALELYRRITGFAPSGGHGWWERARLELVHGDVAAARSSLSAMLEVTRDPGMRAHIFAALDALSGAGS